MSRKSYPSMRTRVKVCCIQNTEEAALALRYGVDALGFVATMPSGPGPIPEGRIAEIVSTLPPAVSSFLLTSELKIESVLEQHRRTQTTTIQICDRVTPEFRKVLKRTLPNVRIVQVVHVEGEQSVEEAIEVSKTSDAVLLDSGSPDGEVKLLGGTGRTHDWSLSKRIRDSIDVPMFLAGGLNADNVAEAIQIVDPFGVDLCTGVRTDYLLDEAKLAAFMKATASTSV